MPLKTDRSLISADFFAERGVTVTRPLQDWLARALYIAKTRPDEASRQRYEYWVISMVEKSLAHDVDWSKVSPSMPSGAPEVVPRLLTTSAAALTGLSNARSAPAYPQQGNQQYPPPPPPPPPPPTSSGDPWVDRQRLITECSKRCPPDMRPFITSVLSTLDHQVQLGRTTYAQTSFTDVLNMCSELQRRLAPPQPRQATVPISSFYSPTAASPLPASSREQYAHAAHVPPPPLPPRQGLAVQPPIYTFQSPQQPVAHARPQTYQQPHAEPTVGRVQERRKRERDSPIAVSFSGSSSSSSGSDSSRSGQGRSTRRRKEQDDRSDEAATVFFRSLINTASPKSNKNKKIVGQSHALERLYSRDEPSALDLRPRRMLPDALAHVLYVSKERGNKYLSDQLKGMRQDLRCQDIKDEFTIGVYERHARLCLVLGNLSEFTQCQAALKKLYEEPFVTLENAKVEEFLCFRLAYLAFGGQYDALAVELSQLVSYAAVPESGGDREQPVGSENGDDDNDDDEDALEAAKYQREMREALRSPASSESYRPPSTNSFDSSDYEPVEDAPARHRFAALATSASVQLATRLCIAVQDVDSVMIVELAREMGVHMQRLVRLFLSKQRVSWLMPLASASRGKIPLQTVLDTLGFLPNLNAVRQLSGKQQKKLLAPFFVTEGSQLLESFELEDLAVAAVAKHGFFIDGGLESAEKEVIEFFTMMKFELPKTFCLRHCVIGEAVRFLRAFGEQSTLFGAHVRANPAIDNLIQRGYAETVEGSAVNAAVTAYVQFLTTRRDTNVEDG